MQIKPLILVFAVLGSIFFGVATVTEAAAVGAIGAILSGVIYRKFSWQVLKEACYNTFKVTSMVVWIVMGATIFASAYTALGAPQLIQKTILSLEVNRWLVLAIMQLIYFILGCMIDPIGILMLIWLNKNDC
ncbi:TRAP transporter large permease subunit [Chloroflexota bacterium]